jgi:hypothetical protein
LEREVLSDQSVAHNVVVFTEEDEISLSPATHEDAVRLYECIEAQGSTI